MVKSCDNAPSPRQARALLELRPRQASYILSTKRVQQRAGSIMDKKAQGSGSGKAARLGIGELLASACSANAPLELR